MRGAEPEGDGMSVDDKLRAAVAPLVAEIVPDLYLGEAEEYCTYNYTESPGGFGDNSAHATRYLVQLHWFLPLKRRPQPKKKQLKQALAAVRGFTAPTVINANDETGQHYVFEFEAVGGGF